MMNYQPARACLTSMNIKSFLEDPSEREWKGPFTFIVGADTQFGMINRIIDRNNPPCWEKEIALTKDLINRINAMNPKPKFLSMCGDMLDAYPFASLSPPCNPASGDCKRREEQFNDFVQLFKGLDPEVKLVCVCGNHDIGDIPTHESLQVYKSQFGSDYFYFWTGGVKFVVLNSQYMYAPDAIPEETEKQMKFLNSIGDAKAKYIAVFQHIPYFLRDKDEIPDYNLSLPKESRLKVLDKLYEQGVNYIFCGHWHRNGVNQYKGMEQVITSAVGCAYDTDPSGYRVVEVGEDKMSHYYVTLTDPFLAYEEL